ncbi:threonine/serine dehydratase [Escherichia coli]|nr:threonine/serine dehydratase [Escherichia coli]
MHITYDLPVAIDDIIEAKQRLAGRIYKTGMPRSNYFSERCKGEIFLKFENMQRTGSFKIRGAFNKLSSLTDAEKRKGVVACSAGNHAQGVSLSCAMLGIDGKVVMPKGAPKSKVAATCDYSAEVVLHGDNFNDTIAKVSEIVEMEGRIFIPPYDDPKVIAGGGLIAGIAVAIKSINPTIRVIGVQSENVHGMAASFHSGEITTHRTTGTLADGCDVSRPGNLTYEIVRELVDDIVLVSEDEIRNSMIALIQRNKVVTEGAGALACAALLSGKLDQYIQNRKTVSIISGGNIDLSRVSQITGFVDA